jgi:hypothetical protein
MERGLLARGQVVRGELRVVDYSRRNRNFAVLAGAGPSYLLKQATSAETAATLTRELDAYRSFEANAKPALASRLPRCLDYDPEREVLMLELLSNARTLREHHSLTGRFSKALGRTIGATLAALHSNGGEGAPPLAAPGVFGLDLPDLALVRDSSPATLQLLTMLQERPEYGERLRELAASWREEATVHGDARWDNWLRVTDRDGRRPGVRLIDWEMWGRGDPRWDLGCFFGDYLGFWIDGLPTAEGITPQTMLDASRYPLDRMHAAAGAICDSYVAARKLNREEGSALLLGAVAFAGVRLLQSCFEACHRSQRMGASHVLRLQVATNVMSRPEAAARHLLGLELPLRAATHG